MWGECLGVGGVVNVCGAVGGGEKKVGWKICEWSVKNVRSTVGQRGKDES